MGYEVERFVNQPDEEFLCSICLGVFENPVHGPCGHTFCTKCIENWIPVNVNTCPLDKKTLHKKDLVSVSIPFRNLLNRLMIKCDFESVGCTTVSMIGCLADHIKVCIYNPDGEMICDQGCDLTFPRRDRESHKCLVALKEVISKQRIELTDLHKKLGKRTYDAAFPFPRMAFSSDRSNFSEAVAYPLEYGNTAHHRRPVDLASRMRSRPSIITYEPTNSRTRTPPPGNHRILLSGGGPTSSASHFIHDISNIEVQLQRLTDEDLESYGVPRSSMPSSSSRNSNGLTNNGSSCSSSSNASNVNGNVNTVNSTGGAGTGASSNNGSSTATNNAGNSSRSSLPAGNNTNATSSNNLVNDHQRRRFPLRQQVADDTYMIFEPFSSGSSSSSSSSPSSSTNHGLNVQQQPCSSSSVQSIGSSNVPASSTSSSNADRFNLLSAILAREPGCSRAN